LDASRGAREPDAAVGRPAWETQRAVKNVTMAASPVKPSTVGYAVVRRTPLTLGVVLNTDPQSNSVPDDDVMQFWLGRALG
jgi:hypothetical protein